MGRVDDAYMGECLRKIAQLATRPRIEFLGEQTKVIAHRKNALERLACLGDATGERIVIGEPKRAGKKGRFASGKSIDGRRIFAQVTVHETLDK